jgi:hypothetical protein
MERHIQPLAMKNLRHKVGHQGEYHTTWEESLSLNVTKVDHGHATKVVKCLHWCYAFTTLSNWKGFSSCSRPYMLTGKLGAAKRITISRTVIVRLGDRIYFRRIPTIHGASLTAWRQTILHPNGMVHTPRNQLGLVKL